MKFEEFVLRELVAAMKLARNLVGFFWVMADSDGAVTRQKKRKLGCHASGIL